LNTSESLWEKSWGWSRKRRGAFGQQRSFFRIAVKPWNGYSCGGHQKRFRVETPKEWRISLITPVQYFQCSGSAHMRSGFNSIS